MKMNLEFTDHFENRHIGPNTDEEKSMLKTIGVDSLETLINQTVPSNIRLKKPLNISAAKSEVEFLADIKKIAQKNKVFKSYIGMGYYGTITPGVIQRNILENPGWYTQYTPYQAEIAQGRLEASINFQTMVIDLTGMEIANASLLDEGTSAAEAMTMVYGITRSEDKTKDSHTFYVSDKCFPQTIDILKTRSTPFGIDLKIGDTKKIDWNGVFGLLIQYPDLDGNAENLEKLITEAHEHGVLVVVASDLLALTLLKPPGEMGADIVVGSSQRFGVPMGYGGPHAAFFATRDAYKRVLPGRIIGVSIDAQGNKAYRMALQTREQHIRRDKATSNICTAQVLLAIMASMYAVYHGKSGIKAIANRVNFLAKLTAYHLEKLGLKQLNKNYFDTLKFQADNASVIQRIKSHALQSEINLHYFDSTHFGISFDESVSETDLKNLISVFAKVFGKDTANLSLNGFSEDLKSSISPELERKSDYLSHPVFNTHHSETEMLRYIKSLENKDLSLNTSMIPLGSCTMKLNATSEMIPVTWTEFNSIHPFAPADQALGYKELIDELSKDLCEVTGFDGVSLQPNSGAQGEYAGLMVIRKYFENRGETHRNVVVIPSSAHGTNPASAVMAGMKVVVTACDSLGNIDVADLKSKVDQHRDNLAGLMVTYPSTHGVFEEQIIEICDYIHKNGGQVYMDGANMNAQVGLTSPKAIGADVCHLNLHKTFCIPHGGGGPGVGPIGVAEHLVPFLPGHPVIKIGSDDAMSAVSAAPWGSANILIISYAYIKMMGGEGLTKATKFAILNANYIKSRLEHHYQVVYQGKNGRCAHEMIFDIRPFKQPAGIESEDIAKRLMDYGYHAPTVSFPVAGTVMIEPTESESKHELDKFCDAMISIRKEIQEIMDGKADHADNVLKNAPHTAHVATADEWKHTYSRQKAVYPLPYVKESKFWPSIGRVNNAHGDRNLICACPPIEEYTEESVS